MIILRRRTRQIIIFCLFSFILFFYSYVSIFAKEINWKELAKTDNEVQFIDTNSIKYNNRGLLSFFTKYSVIKPDDQNNIIGDSYLMAVDCENRLFSKLPVNGEPNQVKEWKIPSNSLIKKTIVNSCTY